MTWRGPKQEHPGSGRMGRTDSARNAPVSAKSSSLLLYCSASHPIMKTKVAHSLPSSARIMKPSTALGIALTLCCLPLAGCNQRVEGSATVLPNGGDLQGRDLGFNAAFEAELKRVGPI